MNRPDRPRKEASQKQTSLGPAPLALRNLLDQGKQHQQAGRLSEAERPYHLALDMALGHPEVLHLLGLLAYRVNRFEQAIDLLSHAIKETPANPLYWFNLGVVTQRAGRKNAAVRAHQRALALNAKYVEALINLGNVLKDLNHLDKAVEAYRKALSLNPNHADTYNNLGVALKEQSKIAAAIGLLSRRPAAQARTSRSTE